METEESLILKLLTTNHLNVQERGLLPNKVIRKSIVGTLVQKELNKFGWFPFEVPKEKGDAGGEYAQIERTTNGAVLHRNVENGLLKFAHIENAYSSAAEAIDEYLHLIEKTGLDGIKIDWAK